MNYNELQESTAWCNAVLRLASCTEPTDEVKCNARSPPVPLHHAPCLGCMHEDWPWDDGRQHGLKLMEDGGVEEADTLSILTEPICQDVLLRPRARLVGGCC